MRKSRRGPGGAVGSQWNPFLARTQGQGPSSPRPRCLSPDRSVSRCADGMRANGRSAFEPSSTKRPISALGTSPPLQPLLRRQSRCYSFAMPLCDRRVTNSRPIAERGPRGAKPSELTTRCFCLLPPTPDLPRLPRLPLPLASPGVASPCRSVHVTRSAGRRHARPPGDMSATDHREELIYNPIYLKTPPRPARG